MYVRAGQQERPRVRSFTFSSPRALSGGEYIMLVVKLRENAHLFFNGSINYFFLSRQVCQQLQYINRFHFLFCKTIIRVEVT